MLFIKKYGIIKGYAEIPFPRIELDKCGLVLGCESRATVSALLDFIKKLLYYIFSK